MTALDWLAAGVIAVLLAPVAVTFFRDLFPAKPLVRTTPKKRER